MDATFGFMGDEHGKLTFENGCPLAPGDKVELIPSHCDTTINLHDVYYVTRGGYVVAVWPIAARGRVQITGHMVRFTTPAVLLPD